MKRGLKWSDGDDDGTSSSDDSSTPDTNSEDNDGTSKSRDASHSSKLKASLQVDPAKKKKKGIDFDALSRHGYRGGLSVLSVPPPKEPEKEQDWSWSLGKDKPKDPEEESFQERQKTRAALADGEQLQHVQTRKEKNLSFQQKEKRKRDIGQASRGKNYVEEEKRLLRDNGVYSGFDSWGAVTYHL